MRKFILLFPVFLILLFNINLANAYTIDYYEEKDLNNFALTPGKFDFTIKPGKEKSKYITIVNRTGETHKFSVETQDFHGTRDPSDPLNFLDNVDSPWSAREWLTPELETFTLRHGERAKFEVKVKVPKDARIGGHYAAVFITTSRPEEKIDNDNYIPIKSRLGALFLIIIPGKVVESGDIKSFNTTKATYYKGPINTDIVFQNDGNIHLKPGGQILIRNQWGLVVDKLKVEQWTVLPDAVRKTMATWDDKPLLRIGKYSAEVILSYGEKEKQFSMAKTTFWVLPLNLIFGSSLLILASSVGLYYRQNLIKLMGRLLNRRY